MTAWAVTDLPEPDSPTTQTISPAPTEKVMSSMRMRAVRAARQGDREAFDGEDGARIRPSHASHPLGEAGIERVAQAVTQHVDGQHRERQADTPG